MLAGLTALALATRRERPWLLFGWAWYLIALGPVVGFVQVGSQARADRYAYIPLIGIFVAIVWETASRLAVARIPAAIGAAGASVIVAALAAAAFLQTATWRNGETLDTHALTVTRSNWLASNNLGNFGFRGEGPSAPWPRFRKRFG